MPYREKIYVNDDDDDDEDDEDDEEAEEVDELIDRKEDVNGCLEHRNITS